MHRIKGWGSVGKSTDPASIHFKRIIMQVMMNKARFIYSLIRIPAPKLALKRKTHIFDELCNKVINLSFFQNKGLFSKNEIHYYSSAWVIYVFFINKSVVGPSCWLLGVSHVPVSLRIHIFILNYTSYYSLLCQSLSMLVMMKEMSPSCVCMCVCVIFTACFKWIFKIFSLILQPF